MFVTNYYCIKCNSVIGESGLCSFECNCDGLTLIERPPLTVIKRKYEMILIEEEIFDRK